MATVEQSAEKAYSSRVNFAATTPAETPNAVGRLGPWQLVRLVSESELARVYQARPVEGDSEQPASYILKVLRREWWQDAEAIEMQRRAAMVGLKLSHPHLLPVLSANLQQPPYYLVTPRVAGQNLAHVLEHQPRLPLPTTLWIIRQVAEGLAELHESLQMIHADVKPSNVIVSPSGHATLIDFGFAHSPSEARHWSARPVMGTLNYIAPEAVTSKLTGEASSDLYSLGVMLYEMIAGRLPFDAKSPEELVRLHREESPRCIRLQVPQLPKPVASLVHRLLSKDPLRRPHSARQLAEELLRLEISAFASFR